MNKGGLRWLTEPTSSSDWNIPDNVAGVFLPVTGYDIDIFNDSLSDEIDSAFTSSICCCDRCYDDFCRHWPDVSFRDLDFQTQSINVFLAVEQSRLPGIYSPAEISTLRHFVNCPRCGNYAPNNIWIYEHRFSDAEEIETAVDELITLGDTTPFLILEHEFAKRVLSEIRLAAGTASRFPPKSSLFRARVASDVLRLNQAPDVLATFAPPPAQYVGEGRFNHAGTPMLYLASEPGVAAAEIGMPGEPCYVAELQFLQAMKVLDLVDLDEDAASYELMRALASSALLAAPHTGAGWLKRQYVFSRFVADCARSAGFDAIRYASTKSIDGANLVLLSPPMNFTSEARLIKVEELSGVAPAMRY